MYICVPHYGVNTHGFASKFRMKHYKHEKVKNVIDYGWVCGSMLRIQHDDNNVCGSTKTKTEKITSTYNICGSKSWTKNEKKTRPCYSMF